VLFCSIDNLTKKGSQCPPFSFTYYFLGGSLSLPLPDLLPVVLGLPPLPIAMTLKILMMPTFAAFRLSLPAF
jgi:hypothetical protein